MAAQTPKQRVSLDRFLAGRRWSEAGEFRRAHAYFSACLADDPGNLLFAEALVLNLRRSPVRRPGFLARVWAKRPLPRAAESLRLQTALARLFSCPDHAEAWFELAAAALKSNSPETARLLLAEAESRCPQDPEILAAYADVLMRFSQWTLARGMWRRLLELAPNDERARQGLNRVALVADQERPRPPDPAGTIDFESLVTRATAAAAEGRWHEALEQLDRAAQIFPGDERIREQAEDVELAQAAAREDAATGRADTTGDAADRALAEQLAEHRLNLELEIIRRRALRYPTRSELQLRLAQLLKQVGQVVEAERVLASGGDGSAAWLLEYGECLQWRRAFDEALACYRRAIERLNALAPRDAATDLELRDRLLYRGGVLAGSAGCREEALAWLGELVGRRPDYRDAATLLDNQRSMRHKE